MDLRLDRFCNVCGCLLDTFGDSEVRCFRKNCSSVGLRKDNNLNEKFKCKISFPKKVRKATDTAMSGPQIEYQCPACSYHLASYFTRQMRSADEGQTVFYICLRCKQVTREE